jgi:hypothetical protein
LKLRMQIWRDGVTLDLVAYNTAYLILAASVHSFVAEGVEQQQKQHKLAQATCNTLIHVTIHAPTMVPIIGWRSIDRLAEFWAEPPERCRGRKPVPPCWSVSRPFSPTRLIQIQERGRNCRRNCSAIRPGGGFRRRRPEHCLRC